MKNSNIRSHYLILEGQDGFEKGLLTPHNITFRGSHVSLPFALDFMRLIQESPQDYAPYNIITHFGQNNEYALLSVDLSEHNVDVDTYDDDLKENIQYKGTVLARTPLSTIIRVNGKYGYIPNRNISDKLAPELDVCVIDQVTSPFQFSEFAQYTYKGDTPDTSYQEDCEMTIERFLSAEELAVIGSDERNEIESLIKKYPEVNRRNIHVVKYNLHLRYNRDTNPDIFMFVKDNPQYFQENNFWVSTYIREAERKEIKIILYDKNNLVMEVLATKNGLWIQELSHDRNKTNAQWLLNHNRNAIAIAGRNIHLHDSYYGNEDFEKLGLKLHQQCVIAIQILPKLRKEIKNIKEKAGVEYLTLKEYLSYQENKENAFNAAHVISIPPKSAVFTTSEEINHPTGLYIPANVADCTLLFSENDTDKSHVQISKTGTDEKIKGFLQEAADRRGCILNFYHSHQDIQSLRDNGFELRRRASTRHLIMQQNSIDNFVHGYRDFDIFDKLNNGALIPPNPAEDIIFFDDKFNNVEEGNNQPAAIRKAVNTNDIFLIQGPPGTGKTSVIVEIIKQLVINNKERVLVCSQAHSAVNNIYERLADDNRLRIGNIDIDETMQPDDLEEHLKFIQSNVILFQQLSRDPQKAEVIKDAFLQNCNYESSSKDIFFEQHGYVCDYYNQNARNVSKTLLILNRLHQGLADLGDGAKAFNNARHYRSLNVVMGTCIGIGMDKGLLKSGIKFDTVIIDEAGKANLSETTVPMQLGQKYILVGDDKQLPPYMDEEEINDFLESDSRLKLTPKEVENALSSSLFEDFLREKDLFPEQSKVLLNFQYRMNPEIGRYISDLFYDGQLQNGRGTEKQECELESFKEAVTFIDTSISQETNNWNVAFEVGGGDTGWYNPYEIDVFKQRVLPRLLRVVSENPNIKIGIITPYRRQRNEFIRELKDSPLNKSVFTIDSIQGSEFDIVVLSFVRAFRVTREGRKVGFLDDMRRLNVALSRAKKKLILIGNLDTLCSESAHSATSNMGHNALRPVDVFRSLKRLKDTTASKTSLDIIRKTVEQGDISPGHIFKECAWYRDGNSNIIFSAKIDNEERFFKLRNSNAFDKYADESQPISVRFIGFNDKDGRAFFEYICDEPMARQVSDGILKNVHGRILEWDENGEPVIEFQDGSTANLKIDPSDDFLITLLKSEMDIPLFIINGTQCTLDKGPYKQFEQMHKPGDSVTVEIVDDYNQSYYVVKCEDIYGKIMRNIPLNLMFGEQYQCSIYRIYLSSVVFNLNRK